MAEIAEMVRRFGGLIAEHDWTPTGWEAQYVRPHDGELSDWRPVYFADLANPLREAPTIYGRPVEGWSAEGEALVVDQLAGRRVPADSLDGFVQLVPTGRLHSVVAAEPGWTVELDTNDEPTTVPMVAWMVDASGAMRPATEGLMSGGRLLENEGELIAPRPIQVLRVVAPE
ncbi:hypothetical protein LWC35_24060 [Pseudonocardia kujensis]|uniref:hypothetical protein n=1 Tax=Pseudonocardia kujensis TaxID=1128675 RepID=UPI001E508FDE|nr:hypothetical protein [Pseudonocardia kujensis]MCE0765956.1 hypothetical protein [Pseudonocardia kujensis]